jgi:predicted dehydrogenase
MKKVSRRSFLKKTAIATSALYVGSAWGFSAKSYTKIMGANDRVRVGAIGFSDRFKFTLLPCFSHHAKALNFELGGIADLYQPRREEGKKVVEDLLGNTVQVFRNNDELYASKNFDAVIISTADFQHALHTIEAVSAGCDAYVEKPFAETMADNRAAKKAVVECKKIVQIGSQRRSGANYHAAADFIKSGKFGNITSVELTWHVNQPGRWRRPDLVNALRESDIDWRRFLINRPSVPFDARKYWEYRLFWPYSSGMPGQWMSHQIDTVHWFTGLKHPRSVVANGGIYQWKDGRENWDTTTAVFDYGSETIPGFQVVFSSRMHNGDDRPTEIYFSNGGELNLMTNKVSDKGGLLEHHAKAMNLNANRLAPFDLTSTAVTTAAAANMGADPTTSAHMLNWMECVRNRKQPNAPVEAGYEHSIAGIMTTAAIRTGQKATFNESNQEVMAGGKIFTF